MTGPGGRATRRDAAPMPDVLTLLTGAALWLTGFTAGRFSRRDRTAATPTCGCTHPLALHDDGGRCHGEVLQQLYDTWNKKAGKEWVPCQCQQFT